MRKHWLSLATLTVALGGVSCTPIDEVPNVLELRFEAVVGDELAACGQTYSGVGSDDQEITVQDVRLYISEVELITEDGDRVDATLRPSEFSSESVGLLDFEDGTGPCSDFGSSATNSSLRVEAPVGAYTGIAFNLGVPFEQNHLDVATAAAPLNVPSMYWAWNGGYKFVRVETTVGGNPYFLHLGSAACASDGPSAPPDEACGRPNLPRVELSGFDPTQDSIQIDLAELFGGSTVAANTEGTAPGCMSGLDDADDCTPIFGRLGLSYDSGACDDDCSGQSVFRVK